MVSTLVKQRQTDPCLLASHLACLAISREISPEESTFVYIHTHIHTLLGIQEHAFTHTTNTNATWELGCNAEADILPSTYRALGLISRTTRNVPR